MGVTIRYATDSLCLDSIDDGKEVNLYRLHKSVFTHEKVVINYQHGKALRGICFRIDKNGNPSTSRINEIEGEVYTNGANANVWFVNENEKEATNTLIDMYENRAKYFKERLAKYDEILSNLKKGITYH